MGMINMFPVVALRAFSALDDYIFNEGGPDQGEKDVFAMQGRVWAA
jgi:hypothetical protein